MQGDKITIGESVLGQHEEFIVLVMKKDFKDCNYPDIADTAETKSRTLEWEGINFYKFYELFKNFRPYVPVEFQLDSMYAEPSQEVLAKVKAKKVDRKEFRATLKKKKYEGRRNNLNLWHMAMTMTRLTGLGFRRVGFFSSRGFFPHNYNIVISARFTPLSYLLLQ
jgi:hypothetical protein